MTEQTYRESVPKTRGRLIRWASSYDTFNRALFLGREQSFREMTADLAQVKPGDKVLDVGCGTGNLTMVAKVRAGPQGEVHGIDAAPEMIEEASRKAGLKGLDIDYQIGLIEDIPFPDDYFDAVLSSLMFHHLPVDLKRAGFAEITRVLKPGGRFVVVDFEPSGSALLHRLLKDFFGHKRTVGNLRLVEALMREAGFKEIRVGRAMFRIIQYLCGMAGQGKDQGDEIHPRASS